MYVHLSTDTLTAVQRGLTTTMGPEDSEDAEGPRRYHREAALSSLSRLTETRGETHGWRRVYIASSPNRANPTPVSGKTADHQSSMCLEMASVKGKKGTGITSPCTNCAQSSSDAGMR